MDINALKPPANLQRALHMVNEKGFSISESAKSCHISQQRLYKAVRAYNTTQSKQLTQLQLKRSKLFQQLCELDSHIAILESKVVK
ncbi:hypothetical protein [Pseudoalteromonas luteoviolacea]|uniref:hypothetical protein n=1 Tax=Pseudoalteromonas luteoviolacea TaxID=43657 RepID=UPI00114F7A4D|nr:hypothetical protein [Pseudoalteromonas luteoviolacea]TQF72054.1 hypothetical protein FLM44_13790 [Pseudoalteromonas luteoviolacea]